MKPKTALWLVKYRRYLTPAAIVVLVLAIWLIWFR